MRSTLMWAAFLGATAIALGALGAHALKAVLDESALDSFKTGVRYQAWHALALMAIALLSDKLKHHKIITRLWIAGTILFSFSIYLLCMGPVWGMNLSFLGPVTPIGGLLMITGWIWLFFNAMSMKNN